MPNLDDLEKKIEEEVKSVYKTADKEIRESWDEYMNMMGKKVNDLYAAYEQAVKAGEKELADDLLYEYQRNVQNMTLQDSRYRAMIRETTAQLAHVNDTALNVVNGRMGQVYTLAYNELDADLKGANFGGYSFTLVDQRTVDYLIANNGSLLPEPSKKTLKEILQKSLDYGKDMKWNSKVLNSQVLQSILQGESIGKMASRLENVTDMNRASAVRNARTMTTNARNKGKQDSIRQAADDGVIIKRVWKSQHDPPRVRVEHLSADGQERDVDEPFDIGGYPLMYPGDRTGPPRLVYNCRCRLGTRIVGFKNESGNGYTAVDGTNSANTKLPNSNFNGNMNSAGVPYNLQFFAEKGLAKESEKSLRKGIESLERRIAEHEEKIAHPEQYADWSSLDERVKAGRIKHWQGEIDDMKESVKNRIEELTNRGLKP